ncbi:hypothetical protein ALC57_13185 [Trachymyrmex cornetzi]|uniref:DUF4817 domain-containing protein n=1 Tax=Trachymyrmex cornetzi TaxID=471704 RepID=A0A151IZX4_9HYME|nr:hypothetical protein ALC57_13185 [Trachymyrmex cornetzi]
MAAYSSNEIVDIILVLGEAKQNYCKAERLYRNRYPFRRHPNAMIDNQHRWSLNTWCGIVNGYLIGPYFFDNRLSGETYLSFLQNKLPCVRDHDSGLTTSLSIEKTQSESKGTPRRGLRTIQGLEFP